VTGDVVADDTAADETVADETQLVTLVYSSSAAQPFRESALEQLLSEFRLANATRSITGMLLFRDGRFVQVLEGARRIVTDLAERIARDPRHEDMRVLLVEPIEARRFPTWTMGFRSVRRDADAIPEGYRDSFTDLEQSSDPTTIARALRELTLWFRVRESTPLV